MNKKDYDHYELLNRRARASKEGRTLNELEMN